MTTESSIPPPSQPLEKTQLQQVRDLGISPLGESFEVQRVNQDGAAEDSDSAAPVERFVLKKVSRARLKTPDRFKQKFDALCRLEHPNLCHYRELYVGERTARITRDFVDGMALIDYLLSPINDEESDELARHTAPTEDAQQELAFVSEVTEKLPEQANAVEALPEPTAQDDRGEALENGKSDDRPATLEIPTSLLEDSEAADRALDLIILRLRRLLPQLIEALEYLHRFRHVHGSLKPNNILITPTEKVVLTDYGLHPELVVPPAERRRYTTYEAPELADGAFSTQADLYSLGAVLFEALSGQTYGSRRTEEEGRPNGELSPLYLSEILPHCPASWADLIHGLLADEPEERPDLDEVRRQLATSEDRSVNIPASVVQANDTLYGRQEILAQLTEYAKSCSQQRRLGLAVVEGETGVGKTALVDALARWAAQLGWVVLHGRCYHQQSVVYQGWEDIVDRLAEITRDLPDKARRRLAGARQRAARLFPQLAIDDDGTTICRQSAVDGLRCFLESLSEQRPILICIDDVHWAGMDSIRLLADLAEAPDGLRVMVVATLRPDTAGRGGAPFWKELATAPIDVERLSIAGFSKQEAREYVLANAAHLSLRRKQKILRKGGFNPLLIDELIHELNDESDLPFATPDDASDEEITPDVDDYLGNFVTQRLVNLNRTERLVLQLLAVASGPLSASLLGRAMSREIGTQSAELVSGEEIAEALVDKRLARRARSLRHSRSEQEHRYVVIHDLCRQVICDELGRDHHARLCGLIADSLDQNGKLNRDLQYEYLTRAGRSEEASRTAYLAAESATARFAHYHAVRLWRWLYERKELPHLARVDFARALMGARHYDEALEIFASLDGGDDDGGTLHLLNRDQVVAHLGIGQREEAVLAMTEALKALSRSYRPSAFGALAQTRHRLLATVGRWSDATAIAADTPADGTTQIHADTLDFALQSAPFLYSAATPQLSSHFGRLARQKRCPRLLGRDRIQSLGQPWLPFLIRQGQSLNRWQEQATKLFAAQKDHLGQARVFEFRALLAHHQGKPGEAQEHLAGAQQSLREAGQIDPLLHARITLLAIDLALLQGERCRAHKLVMRLLHRVRGQRWLTALATLALLDLAIYDGDLDKAQRYVDQLEAFVGDDHNCTLHLWIMERKTRLNVGLGRPEVAVAQWDLLLDGDYRAGLKRLSQARLIIYRNLALSLSALAKRQIELQEPRRRETIRRLKSALRRLSDLQPWMGVVDACAFHRLQARYEMIRRRPNRALRHLRSAAALCGEESFVMVCALNQEATGFVLKALEEPEARTALDGARATYVEHQAFLPLVFEGWPVPSTHSVLKEDLE